jgi:Zn-dependent protease
MPFAQPFSCRRCASPLGASDLACFRCGELVHKGELERLSGEAQRWEAFDPMAAANAWRRALPLLPPASPQRQMLVSRISMLESMAAAGFAAPGLAAGGYAPPAGQGFQTPVLNYAPAGPRRDTPLSAIAKTGGSMVLSIAVYSFFFGPAVATGFVLLILIHELGHVVAMRYYGLRASTPIFIPFIGALINLRERPQNALVEAVVGIGGPIAGTLAALVAFVAYLRTGSELALLLSELGFFLNLFNLLPVPPLDGGRVTAAISPWLWLGGLAGAGVLMGYWYVKDHTVSPILVLMLFMAFPRVWGTLRRGRFGDYYRISAAATWSVGVLYFALAAGLALLTWKTHQLMPLGLF